MSGSIVRTGSGINDTVHYKSSTEDAQNTVNEWFQRGMGRPPTDAEMQKWTQSVQRDGSHTAYLDFSGKISKGDPGAERKAAGANIEASGWNGYSPLSGSEHEGEQQLPGTSTGFLKDAAPNMEAPAKKAGVLLMTLGASGGQSPNFGGGNSYAPSTTPTPGGGTPDRSVWDQLGGLIPKKTDGSWDWDKIGSMVGGGIDAYGKNRTASSNIEYQNKSIQLGRDAQTMNDQQFAAKYGMDKSAATAQVDEFNKNFGLQSSQVASAAQSRLNTAPLRDQANYIFQRSMGAPSEAFHPGSIFTGGADALNTAPTGGAATDIAAMNTAKQGYSAGAGGTHNDVDQGIVNKYANATPVTYHDPGSYTGRTTKAPGGYSPSAPASPPPANTPPIVKGPDIPATVGAPLVPAVSTTGSVPDPMDDPVTKARKLLMARMAGGMPGGPGMGAGGPPQNGSDSSSMFR
jgi:hypothetical protein